MVEHLLHMQKVLGSISSTRKGKKEGREGRRSERGGKGGATDHYSETGSSSKVQGSRELKEKQRGESQ